MAARTKPMKSLGCISCKLMISYGDCPAKMAHSADRSDDGLPISFEPLPFFRGQYSVPPFFKAVHAMKEATSATRTLPAAAGKQANRFHGSKFFKRLHRRVNNPGSSRHKKRLRFRRCAIS